IVARTIYALVNEAARIVQDGIAQRPSDIDVVYVAGYGFPMFRGGPMFYADTVGLPKVLETICRFHAEHGEYWEPAPLLVELAESGGRFSDRRAKGRRKEGRGWTTTRKFRPRGRKRIISGDARKVYLRSSAVPHAS